MIDSEEEIITKSAEYEEHKRRREERKKQKMQLLEVSYVTEVIARNSELQEVEESLKLFDASSSKPMAKNNRRKTRTRKNVIDNDEIVGNNLLELEEMAASDVLDTDKNKDLIKIKAKINHRRTRSKKNSNAEMENGIIDYEGVERAIENFLLDEPDVSYIKHTLKKGVTISSNKNSARVSQCCEMTLSDNSCHRDASSKVKTINKKSKMKNNITSYVTLIEKKNYVTKSSEVKNMHSPKYSEDKQNKKRNSNIMKDKLKQYDSKNQSKTPNETQEKEKFGDYMDVEKVKEGLESGLLFIGNIRINPKDNKLSYVNNPVKDEQDILVISIRDRNGSLEGDKVVIELKPESEWKTITQKTGHVVFILEKVHPRTAVGVLKLMADKNKRYALFHPRDTRVPRMKIPFTCWPTLFFEQAEEYEKVLFLAKITKWLEPRYPIGTIVRNIGFSGDIEVESQAILAENCLDVTPYDEEMKQYFPQSNEIDPKEFDYRLDLRNDCIFTIDPLTARDLDDAVSCKQLPNGNFEIGVHISDVTYYLEENTPLDEIVSQKATSIYMVDSVYHMLPKELCMLCSLLPGEDKLAFSVIWEITPEGKIISHKFSRTVINSCVQLAYEHAQAMIEDPEKEFSDNELPTIHNGYKYEEISKIVNILHKISVNLRQSRYKSGALRIDQPKITFSLNPQNGLPLSYRLYENKDCHRLIEEFMLLANITVATRLRTDYPDIAFLRSHQAPNDYMLHALKSNLEKIGIHLDVSTAGGLQQTLWKYSGDDILSQARMMVLNLMCAKPMARAHYFCANNCNDTENYWHYALSIPLYTHFTSPIRRFADIVVHRQLAGSLGYREKPDWTTDYVISAADTCDQQKYNAKRAGEQSIQLYLIHYIGQHQPVLEKAVVMDVKDRSFDAIVIANGCTVRIYLNDLDEGVTYSFLEDDSDDELEDAEEGKRLLNLIVDWPAQDSNPSVSQIIAMFSIITVSLSKKEKAFKLDVKLVRPEKM